MSDTTAELGTTTAPTAAEHDDHGGHPSDAQYVWIAIILGVLTALEFLTYFSSVLPDFINDLALPILLVLMAVKFFLVVAYFMHLKFDHKLLRQIFVFGLLLAVAVYFATLQAFRFFSGFNTPN